MIVQNTSEGFIMNITLLHDLQCYNFVVSKRLILNYKASTASMFFMVISQHIIHQSHTTSPIYNYISLYQAGIDCPPIDQDKCHRLGQF